VLFINRIRLSGEVDIAFTVRCQIA